MGKSGSASSSYRSPGSGHKRHSTSLAPRQCAGSRDRTAVAGGGKSAPAASASACNEITAVPELLRVLELSGCIVTIDALGSQKKIAHEICDADADEGLALKGKQETVRAEMKSFLDQTVAERATPPPT